MDEKKMINEEELDKVSGGSLSDSGVIRVCDCGGEITLDCEARTSSSGLMELKCPNCDTWYRVH